MLTLNEQIKELTEERLSVRFYTERRICDGLCTREAFKGIKEGETITDLRLVKLLIERMGKCPNKLELVVNEDMLEIETTQLLFDDAMDTGDSQLAKVAIDKLKFFYDRDVENRVARMYYLRNQAYYYYNFLHDDMKALECMETAVNLTVPMFEKRNILRIVLSTTELENILALCYFRNKTRKTSREEVRLLADDIKEYILKHIDDEEELANIVPKSRWVSAMLYIDNAEYEKAVTEAEEGLELLRKYAVISFMPELLNIIIKYGKTCILSENFENYIKYKETLDWLINEFANGKLKTDSLFVKCNRGIYHYEAEVIGGQRKVRGISQEKLAEAAELSPDAISRYEHGKRSPNKSSYPRLMGALGLEWGKQNTVLATKDFKSLEKEEEINVLLCMGEYKKAEKLIKELESEISTKYRRNVKVLMTLKHRLAINNRNTDFDKIIEVDKKLLGETYPFFDKQLERAPFSDEAALIMEIGVCYARKKDIEATKVIYKKMIDVMNQSKVNTLFRQRTYGVCLTNYAQSVRLDEWAKKAVSFRLKGRSLSEVYRMISELSVHLYDTNDYANSKFVMINALYAAELIKANEGVNRIQGFIENYYS